MSGKLTAVLVTSALGLVTAGMASSVSAAPAIVALSALNGATTPTSYTLSVDVPSATAAKLFVDGSYVGKDDQAPLLIPVAVGAGPHWVMVRATVGGLDQRTDARFTASTSTTPSTSTPSTITAPPGSTTTTSTTAPGPVPGEVVVSNPTQLADAVAAARPGSVIRLLDGEYQNRSRLMMTASGTPGAPIILRGSRNAVIRTKNASGDYGLSITGDYWRVEGLTVAHATKGIVLDGSVGTVIDGVEVYDIGDEAVHFRTCSSDGVLRNSFIHDTGRNSAQYGEGVYVGSANSNWSNYQCTDARENRPQGDNTERVLVENNVFEDITAEGADLKEGTDSGTMRNNVFRRAGNSGQNSADSAIDAKGNNWLIEGNTVSESNAPWDDNGVLRLSEFLDGYQSHSVYAGYGTGNQFRRNTVVGPVPGFGIGLNPALANVVTCDNSAPGAARGLVGDKNQPAACLP